VAEREPDGKGLPVLLVDLRHTDPRLLQRYLPAEARPRADAAAFRGERQRRYMRALGRLSTNQR
jgi:hypothetical protein